MYKLLVRKARENRLTALDRISTGAGAAPAMMFRSRRDGPR